MAVDLSAAAVDALRPAWDAANAALQADGQALIDAVEAAMACESGQMQQITDEFRNKVDRSDKHVLAIMRWLLFRKGK